MFKWVAVVALSVLAIAAAALGFPPLETTEVTRHEITLSNLDCDTRYEVRVRERRNNAWRDARTITRTTDACADPPDPPDPPEPPVGGFPNPATTGTPAGWVPTETRSTSLTVNTNGAVVENIRFNSGAGITVNADNVTIRNVELNGGVIVNDQGCPNSNLLIDNVTLQGAQSGGTDGAIRFGGYTVRDTEILDRPEGIKVSGASNCEPVVVENTFMRIRPPSPCGDWHGDGIQGFNGDGITVSNVTIDMTTQSCTGTAPFFYPHSQGNTPPVNINRLLVMGQGAPFRLGIAGSVTGLRIVNNSWVFFPIDVKCSVVAPWEAKLVTIDSNYQVTSEVANQPCDTEAGN